jgi:2-dehydro-3-deoxygluconokinase
MLEFAPVGDALYKRGFAGDTLNTCWHIAALLGERAEVGYFTAVGADAASDALVAFVRDGGMDVSAIARDPGRTLGLYVISLEGAERSFSYWRENSAARRLADDPTALACAFAEAALIHVSGITLAIVGEGGRLNLFRALAQARGNGARVSFDPNLRPRLWRGLDEARDAFSAMWDVTDIALPSFDDEAQLWGDAEPRASAARIAGFGVGEIAVKNGAGHAVLHCDGETMTLPTPPASLVRDTTGAGDGFNAGYLAARHAGFEAREAVGFGQGVATEIIGHFGALAPRAALQEWRRRLIR